jgi:hypothetical protein
MIWKKIMALFCLMTIVSISFAAAEDSKADMKKKDMMKGCVSEKAEKNCGCGMMEKGKMMGMSHMMMSRSLVATTDGGVVVMAGNKLQKYDKDLMLVKEVELKIDMEAMKKMMPPMACEKMEKDKGMEKGKETGKK